MTRRASRGRCRALGLVALAVLAACDEDNPFRNAPLGVSTGEDRIWELDLAGFPSGFDFLNGTPLFIGAGPIGSRVGDVLLDARPDGTLVFRPFSVVAPGLSVKRVGIQDLGDVAFDAVEEVPEDGYSAVEDTTGVPVVDGHVYAIRIADLGLDVVPINYAKLEVVEIEQQDPGEPRSRFVRFRYSYQIQPLNRRVVAAED